MSTKYLCNHFAKLKWIGPPTIEYIINMGISLLPFGIGIMALIFSTKYNLSYPAALYKIIENGELLIYCSTLMAPIAYAVVREPPVKFKALFSLTSIVIIVAGSIIYAIRYFDSLTDSIVMLSQIAFMVSAIIYFALLLLDARATLGASAPMIEQQNSLSAIENYKAHRGID